jgi:hypothetical protein
MAQMLGLGKKGKLVDTTGGIIGDAAQGIGIGLGYNVIDKKFLNGKMTALGVNITSVTVAGAQKQICLNVTDALTYASVVGLKFNFKKGDLIKGLAAIGAKKFMETWGYMDPPGDVSNVPSTQTINYPAMRTSSNSLMFVGGRI